MALLQAHSFTKSGMVKSPIDDINYVIIRETLEHLELIELFCSMRSNLINFILKGHLNMANVDPERPAYVFSHDRHISLYGEN